MNRNLSFWIAFNLFVVLMLALDLGVFHRKQRRTTIREALAWTCVWIVLAMIFAVFVDHALGRQKAIEFLTGYVIEKSLSLDNIFVFALIFTFFKTPAANQHKILFWGIIGALIMRALFILAGIAVLERFHWTMYIFGGILLYTGVRLFMRRHREPRLERNLVVRLCIRYLPFTSELSNGRFFVRQEGKLRATPLLLVLIVVEATDLVFAIDSIPAILAISRDSFIVYTSNVFAILGLRSLYFALAGIIRKFRYLETGLAMILLFVGIKMILADVYEMPVHMALVVIVSILAVTIALSVLRKVPADNGSPGN